MDIYKKLGASATKEEVKKAVEKENAGLFPGAFCKVMPDFAGDENYCSLMHADGAGTKSILAYMMYKETGDASYFYGIAQDSMVMNIDDMLCVGATGPFYMSNTIGRNAHRIPGQVIEVIIAGYNEVCKMLSHYGVEVVMTGGETADVGDIINTIIVDSTMSARMKRSDCINNINIAPGDVIVGLSSFGRSVYEKYQNSGIGSNGLTAARHLLLDNFYAQKYPETYSSTLNADNNYLGKWKLEDIPEGCQMTVGDMLLSPTRTYAPVIYAILQKYRHEIHGMVHCTGGGQQKCKNFGKGIHYIKDDLFPMQDIFRLISGCGIMGQDEMYQVFNMGHRLEIFCKNFVAEEIINISKSFGVDAKIIGKAEKSETGDNKVTIIS